jgi:hypothetical protein
MATAAPAPNPPAHAAADEHVFLIGRPPVTEYLSFVAQTIEGEAQNRAAFMDQWRAANDHLRELQRDETGFADSPRVRPLPDHLFGLQDQVMEDSITTNSFSNVPFEIGIVELDRLVVFQKHVNVGYVGVLRGLLGDDVTDEDVFRFCLPFDRRYDPNVEYGPVAPNAWGFASPSQDFRPLDATVLDPSQVTGLDVGGAPVAIVAVVVGYGCNYLNAVRVEDRLVLNNGSHRAYALREAGHTHAPCLIQNVSRREELEVVSQPVAQQVERLLDAGRPPVLRDYFDAKLRLVAHMPRRKRQVTVQVNVDQTMTPGA